MLLMITYLCQSLCCKTMMDATHNMTLAFTYHHIENDLMNGSLASCINVPCR